jgi:hypothetical protein
MGSYVSANAHLPARRILALNTETAPDRSLADPQSSAVSGFSRWSQAVAARYQIQLSPELEDWFDRGVCGRLGNSEFCEPASPEQLISDAPDCIWPGLMPPDVLPLVGNGLGDWLCGRVSAEGTIDEIIYWYHGGGDYLPYGSRLAEAILFDALSDRLPGRRQLHAVPAEREPFEYQPMVCGSLVDWALSHLPHDVGAVLQIDAPPSLVLQELRRHKIALDAVRCDEVLAAMDNDVRVRMTAKHADRMGVSWERDVAKWMFDTATIPEHRKRQLMQLWSEPADASLQQDWATAETICLSIADERDDLGWVHDCLGWAAQRRGDIERARDHYQKAAVTSLFTDQAVRFRSYFDSDKAAKFSIARLEELGIDHDLDPRYVAALKDIANPQWRAAVESYWLSQSVREGVTHAERYDFIYRAGWDVGCDSMARYRDLLIQLSDAATAAGQVARAEVARTHAACIDDRYRNRAMS